MKRVHSLSRLTQSFSEWDKIFGDAIMTVATIDRLVHHATALECDGDSFRKKASINRLKKAAKAIEV